MRFRAAKSALRPHEEPTEWCDAHGVDHPDTKVRCSWAGRGWAGRGWAGRGWAGRGGAGLGGAGRGWGLRSSLWRRQGAKGMKDVEGIRLEKGPAAVK